MGLSEIGQFILLSQLGAAPGIDYEYCYYPRVGPGSRLRSVSGASPCAENTSAGASRSVVRLVKLLSVALTRSLGNFSLDKSILDCGCSGQSEPDRICVREWEDTG